MRRAIPQTQRVGRRVTTLEQRQSEPWITATLQNLWVAYGLGYATPSYFKDPFGIVFVRGMVKNGTIVAGTPVFTLPVGYRPPEHFTVDTPTFAGPGMCQWTIGSDGVLSVTAGGHATWTAVPTVCFRAA